ncbi:MAG: hypothetical protein QGH60_18180 [Phycisphaerae bacterium]|jgi:hypothetical protein|nr:hypothetical protein [Phycisphaerae bacterium]
MIELRPKTLQIVWLAISAALFVCASLVHKPIDRLSRQHKLVPAGDAALARHPDLAVISMAPGGLRSLGINYFWMRSQTLHREGRHFDAMQTAEMICMLQPRFPGVWQFQSWQLAWNISATAHTPEERWHWVRAGIELLRDRGIVMNPNSLLLYKQLSWTFISKMGDNTDETHWYYKKKWAQDMQYLLGGQPFTTTQEVLAAFKEIADAPLGKEPYRSRKAGIQRDKRQELLDKNPDVVALARNLGEAKLKTDKMGLKIDAGLLRAYNFCTLSETVDITRIESVDDRNQRLRDAAMSIDDPLEKARRLAELDRRAKWAKVINNPAHKKALDKALAFVRAQMLWSVHKMDPDYMYKMMQRFGPIDWRLVASHGLYWSMYGVDHCTDVPKEHIDWLNTDRTLLTCLKTLSWQGKMDYTAAPRSDLKAEEPVPTINFRSDWRFIETTHQEYMRLGAEQAKLRKEEFEENPLDTGHINFLDNAIAALYVRGRRQEAQKYFDWVRKNYKKADDELWGADNLESFVRTSLRNQENLILRVTTAQLTAGLQAAMVWLARGKYSAFESNIGYARRFHREYHKSEVMRSERLALPPLEVMAAGTLSELLVRPELLGLDMPLAKRSMMYRTLRERWPGVIDRVYNPIRRPLMRQCQADKLDFDSLFPPPRSLEIIRQRRLNGQQQQQK